MRAASTGDIPPAVEVDLTRPSIARVYDYVLGGKDNFAVDRSAAQAVMTAVPEAPNIARDNRDFLRRGVSYLVAEAGITQIIDIGSGLPTVKNVHEIAHEANPSVRVVYADIDPVVLTHGRVLLADDGNATVITADVTQPDTVFGNPGLTGYIDLAEPFAVLIAGLLHHLNDAEDPPKVVAAIRDRLPSGSYLLITNFLDDGSRRASDLQHAFLTGGLGAGRFRTLKEQSVYFDGLDLVDPGFVPANEWRPDELTRTDSPVTSLYAGGIGRKR
ncbi:MAG: SAM-dependent methyltransferase [Pseudonocardiales bacterium]|nr:MAG: SAM-dependent methyltransferase [Pseudonocardiales bacterium]